MFRSSLASLLLLLFQPTLALAEDVKVAIPPGTKVAVQVDLATFGKTSLGKMFLKLTEKIAAEEIGEDGEDVMANVKTALGFDPLTEVQSMFVLSSSYEEPESNIQGAIVKLGKTTGNLEGLILSLPLMLSLKEYKTVKHGEHTIHCAADDGFKGFVAIHSNKQTANWVLGSFELDSMRVMLDGLDSKAGMAEAPTRLPAKLTDGDYARIHLLDLSGDVFDLGGEVAEITEDLQDVYVSFKEDDASTVVSVQGTTDGQAQAGTTHFLADLSLTMFTIEASKAALQEAKEAAETSDEARERYSSSIEAYKASLKTALGPSGESDDVKPLIEAYLTAFPKADVSTKVVLEFLKNATVSSDGNDVILRASVPTKLLTEFFSEEVDLPQ